jgi:CheY-like chemotaxis protein
LIGDAGRLRQILVNLVGNAVKFTDDGAVTVRFAVAEPASAGSFVLQGSIEDTGIGIAQSQQAVIFDAFTQVAGWTTSAHGGTGLGLAITRRLVELMGGEVHLESTLGAGSRFTFTVRLGMMPVVASTFVPLTAVRILVVDPNPHSRQHVTALLRAHEADVLAVGDADEARALLARAPRAHFDAVIVNPPAPEAGQGSLATTLRAVPGLEHLPYVGLVPRLHVRGNAELDHFAVTVPKPIKRQRLVATLATLLPAQAATATG